MKLKPLLSALVCTAGLLATGAHADGINAGIEIQDRITVADLGLPAYPGAVPQRDEKEEKSGVGFSLWGGSFGIKLQVLKFRSADSVDKVSAFYREALSRYGKVLDCSVATAEDEPKEKSGKASLRLGCSKEDSKAGKLVFKVGTDDKHFRLVSLQRESDGTHFQMVNLSVNGD